METKKNYAGEQQPMDEKGRYTFKNFHKPQSIDNEIAKLTEDRNKLSFFDKRRMELTNKIKELENQKQGENSMESKKPINNTPKEEKPKIEAEKKPQIKDDEETRKHKQKQLDIVLEANPMRDDYHRGIRKIDDILSPSQAFGEHTDDNYAYPDFTYEDGQKALEKGKITIYSSKPIINGNFVSPSKMLAQMYAGNGKVYSLEVDLNDVAWLDSDEGQVAKIKDYTKGYIENNKWLNNFDEQTRDNMIDGFTKMPKNQQFYYSLNDKEKTSLVAMQMNTWNINEYMSGRRKDFNDETKKELDEQIKNVKSAINQYDLEKPITLYRGVSKAEFDGIEKDGKTTSFKSASTNEKTASNFAKNQGGYIIEYRVGKGGRVADVDGVPGADEDEYLIDSDIPYKKMTRNGNRVIIEI